MRLGFKILYFEITVAEKNCALQHYLSTLLEWLSGRPSNDGHGILPLAFVNDGLLLYY